jgi:hypothetical protein
MTESVDKTQTRRAKLSRYDGDCAGICIYLTASELCDLGIDPSQCQFVSYTVGFRHEEPVIRLSEVETETEANAAPQSPID